MQAGSEPPHVETKIRNGAFPDSLSRPMLGAVGGSSPTRAIDIGALSPVGSLRGVAVMPLSCRYAMF